MYIISKIDKINIHKQCKTSRNSSSQKNLLLFNIQTHSFNYKLFSIQASRAAEIEHVFFHSKIKSFTKWTLDGNVCNTYIIDTTVTSKTLYQPAFLPYYTVQGWERLASVTFLVIYQNYVPLSHPSPTSPNILND